jgi:hypothetical protein
MRILLGLLLVMSMSVFANTNTAQKMCNIQATFAENVASARDEGIPQQIVAESVFTAHKDHLRTVIMAFVMIDFVYSNPNRTPDEFKQRVYVDCLKSMGVQAWTS